MVDRLEQSKALASQARLSVLGWLADPQAHFAHQVTGPPAEIGVCVTLLAARLEMAQPTVSRHLEVLRRAGFVTVRRIGKWAYFQRNEAALADYKAWINDHL
ncbi:ArsR family transcriptional regulator [Roseospirillum parvum]|uniref:ArsR family transcriptional regulator n=2 Tax=Roseospirillum parvum TaxID=83401 RepID=A0A1G8CWB4_9PROT|nr:ArsR family transcriptional regulator [Roseospirillum parvum]